MSKHTDDRKDKADYNVSVRKSKWLLRSMGDRRVVILLLVVGLLGGGRRGRA